MKVLMISFDRHLFSPASDVAERMRALGARLTELHIIVYSLQEQGLAPQQLSSNVWLYPTQSSSKLMRPLDAVRIARTLPAVEVVTAQDPFDAGIAGAVIARRRGIPLQVQEHGDFYSTTHWRGESWMNFIRYYLGLLVLRRSTCVRVVSERIKQTLIACGVPVERIAVFPVRTSVAVLREAQPQFDLHEKYPDASMIILTLARLVPQKNLCMLIDAFAEVVKKHPDALLLIVGEGPEKERLARRAGERGVIKRVVFEPWAQDVASYYKTSDLYALSSNYEGWGRVLIEAMACGLPAVTTEVGLVGEVFRDGEHGRVVPIGDTCAFAAALNELIENPALRREMGERERRDVKREDDDRAYLEAFVESVRQCKA